MNNNPIRFRKNNLLIFCTNIFCLVHLNGFSQKQNPIGTIFLKENIYIDAAPVSNVYYREFEYFQKQNFHYNIDSLGKMTKTLPYYKFNLDAFERKTHFIYNNDSLKYKVVDTSKTFWNNWISFKEYLYKPRFNFFPLVNISQEAAENFCRWRTYMVKIIYSSLHIKEQRKEKFDDFVYRLPTNEELELASKKFIVDKKISVQQKLPEDSIANFNNSNFQSKTNLFKITSLQEIAISNNKANSVYWDINNFTFFTNKLLKQNEVHENLTFRCVCEIK